MGKYCIKFLGCCCCCSVAKSCLTLLRPHGLWPTKLLSMGFSRQEHLSGLLFPSPGDLPNSGIKTVCLHWQEDSLPLSHWEKELQKRKNPTSKLKYMIKAEVNTLLWRLQHKNCKSNYNYNKWAVEGKIERCNNMTFKAQNVGEENKKVDLLKCD